MTEKELAGKKLIPADLVLYHKDKDNCKVEIYILNRDKTKMKTFEDFKNKTDKFVKFLTTNMFLGTLYYKGENNHKEYGLHYASTYGLRNYVLKDDLKKSYTTVEDIEKFIEVKENELKTQFDAKNEQQKKYKEFVDKNFDKSLDF